MSAARSTSFAGLYGVGHVVQAAARAHAVLGVDQVAALVGEGEPDPRHGAVVHDDLLGGARAEGPDQEVAARLHPRGQQVEVDTILAPSRAAISTASGFRPPTAALRQIALSASTSGTASRSTAARSAVGTKCDFSTQPASPSSVMRRAITSGATWTCRS
jgi:hypothetical protein